MKKTAYVDGYGVVHNSDFWNGKYTDIPGHKYSQCTVIITPDNDYILRSYTTNVAVVTSDGYISCSGTYSATTRKQLGWFANLINTLRLYGSKQLSYYDFKNVAYDARKNNYLAFHPENGDIILE